jgi:hypothetical protein
VIARWRSPAEVQVLATPPANSSASWPWRRKASPRSRLGRKQALRQLSEDKVCIHGQQLDLRAHAEPPLEALKMSRGEPVIETLFGGTGADITNPYRTEPGDELRTAGSVGDLVAGLTKGL